MYEYSSPMSLVTGQQSHYPRKLLSGLPSRYYVFQLPEMNLDTEDTTVPPQDISKYMSAIHIPSPSRLAKVITYKIADQLVCLQVVSDMPESSFPARAEQQLPCPRRSSIDLLSFPASPHVSRRFRVFSAWDCVTQKEKFRTSANDS